MGNFIDQIKNRAIQIDTSLLNCTSSKLRQYYSSYRSICQNLSFNVTQYIQIFGSNQKSFSIWDPEKYGNIDAIEMFSGLIVYSNSNYKQKIRFLFEIFDLNEQGFLTYQALTFMLVSICNSSFKIYSIYSENKKVKPNQIDQFLSEFFSQESQITIDLLLRWSNRVQQFNQFFKIIGHPIEQKIVRKNISPCKYNLMHSKRRHKFVINQKSKLNYHYEFDPKIFNMFQKALDSQTLGEQFNPKIDWVYGIRIDDIRQPLKYTRTKGQKAANDRLIYLVGKIIIIYFPKLNTQKHYTQHQKQVSCFEISESKKYVASGQMGDFPSIHIWNLKSVRNISKFKQIHCESITMMKFIKKDEFLITMSERNNSPLIVININTGQKVLSTSIDGNALNIFPMIDDKQCLFMVVSSKCVSIFQENNQNAFTLSYFKLGNQNENERIVSSIKMVGRDRIVTLNNQGQVKLWNTDYSEADIIYEDKTQNIVQLSLLKNGSTVIILKEHKVQLLELRWGEMQENFSVQLINQIEVDRQLHSMSLVYIFEIDQNSIYVLSLMGDLLYIPDIYELRDQTGKCQIKKVYQIFKMETISGSCLSLENSLLIAASNIVYIIDNEQHQLSTTINIQQDIVSIHSYANITAVATLEKYVYVIVSDEINQKNKINNAINDLKVIPGKLLVATQNQIQIFTRSNEKFFEKASRTIKLDIYSPIHISLTEDPKAFIVMTKQKYVFKFDLQLKFRNITVCQKMINQIIETVYQNKVEKVPLLFSIRRSFFLSANQYGDIIFWNSATALTQNPGVYGVLSGHSSPVVQFLAHPQGFISVGSTDGQVISWSQVRPQKDEEEQDQNIPQQNARLMATEKRVKPRKLRTGVSTNSKQEKAYWNSFQPVLFDLKDDKLKVCSLDEQTNREISKVIKRILNPVNRTLYQPLINQNLANQPQPPLLSINIDHLYGFQSEKIRKSLFFLHSYQEKAGKRGIEIDKKPQIHEDTVILNSVTKRQFQYAKVSLLPFDQIHKNCKRSLIYFQGRIPIISYSSNKQQRFYNFHRNQVTALAIHPNKNYVCSCQMGNPTPLIHVWQINQMTMMHCIKSIHSKYIYRAQFSRDGDRIITLGGQQKNCSIQVTNWKNEQILAYRHIENHKLCDIQFNPYDNQQFAVCGDSFLKIFKVSNRTLIIKEQSNGNEQQLVTFCYTSSIFGDTIESDILTGSSDGDISIFVCGKFIVCKQNAHDGQINCLRMAQLFGYKTVLISLGEDNFINIWDTKFNKINQINAKQFLQTKNLIGLSKVNCAPQSIDVFHCCGQSENIDTILLIGTRNGNIFEAKITNQYQGLKVFLKGQKTESVNEKITINYFVHSSHYPSGQATFFQINNNYMINFSKNSPIMYLWNISNNQMVKIIKLQSPPCLVQFSKTNLLLVGYASGLLQVYMLIDGNLYIKDQYSEKDCKPICAAFSAHDLKLGVCFSSNISQASKNVSIVGSAPLSSSSFVIVFERFDDWKKAINQQGKQKILKMTNKIVNQKKNLSQVCWMEFSTNFSFDRILLCYNEEKQNSNIKSFKRTKFVILNISQKCQKPIENQEFLSLDFSSKIKANYVYLQQLISNGEQDFHVNNKNPIITAMSQYDNYTILGTNFGELIFIHSQAFYNQENGSKNNANYQTKCYTCFSSAINKIHVVDDFIYLTSVQSRGVVRYSLIKQQLTVRIGQSAIDQFSEPINNETLDNKIKYIYPKRKNAYQCKLHEDQEETEGSSYQQGQLLKRQSETQIGTREEQETKVSLDLKLIIGRNALFKRNNIFIDLKDNLVSYSGCNLLIMKKPKQGQLLQQFLKVDISPFSTNPQIACISFSSNRRTILAATNQLNCKLLLWDISTKSSMASLTLNSIIQILNIKISDSSDHAIALGVTREHNQILVFISFKHKNPEILACHLFNEFKHTPGINDLAFFPHRQFSFISCGNEHMIEWHYQDNSLTFQRYNLQNPKDFIDLTQKNNTKQPVIFYSIIFVKDLIITSGSDGYLYLWLDKKIYKKQNAHPKSAILAIYSSRGSKIFASGAVDGKAIIWQVGSSSAIQKVFQFSIYAGKQMIVPTKFHIQSVCIGKNEIIVGTRSGQIYQFACNSEQITEETSYSQKNKQNSRIILSAFDNDLVNSCSFNTSSQKLYVLTQSGTFSVFNLNNLEKIKEEKIDIGNSEIVKMLVCKISTRIFIVLRNTILVYAYYSEVNDQKFNKFRKLKENLKSDSNIKAAILSLNEKYMAILIVPQLQNAKIEVYCLDNLQGQFYTKYRTLENIAANIQIIDFSTDNGYLVYKNDEEQTVMDLLSRQIINTNSIEFQLEWNEDAKKTSKNIRDISTAYSDQNRLLRIVQVMNHSILATDQMGSLRVFKYPLILDDQQLTHKKFYLEHLNTVNLAILSSDSRTLVTVGKEDRSILIWKMKTEKARKKPVHIQQ